jgi:hypothetical protein
VEHVIESLEKLPLVIPNKQWLVDSLLSQGFSEMLALWMTTNLRPVAGGGVQLTFDIPTVKSLYHSYKHTDFWPLLENPPAETDFHFVRYFFSKFGPSSQFFRALKNTAWTDTVIEQFQSLPTFVHNVGESRESVKGRIFLHEVDAGHWLHVENFNGLVDVMRPSLSPKY